MAELADEQIFRARLAEYDFKQLCKRGNFRCLQFVGGANLKYRSCAHAENSGYWSSAPPMVTKGPGTVRSSVRSFSSQP